MRAILEKSGADRFLEFVLSESEVKLIMRYHLITKKVYINGKVYNIGIRVFSPSETYSEEEPEEENAINER